MHVQKTVKSNAFSKANLTDQQTEALNYVTRMLNWRKESKAVESGKLVHFLPQNNCYVYFRISKEETLMVILNNGDDQEKFELATYQEILKNFSTGTNVIDNQEFDLSKSLKIKAKTPYVLILK